MSKFLDELVFIMPPSSTAALERRATEFLLQVAPSHLKRPSALEVLDLAENILPQKLGIRVYPASPQELGPREGATDPTSDEGIEVLIHERVWEELLAGGRRANRARATVMHEIAHAYEHVPFVRRFLSSFTKPLLPRVRREELPVYRDQEWQAWTLAGCMMMPRQTLLMLKDLSTANVAEVYEVSEDFAAVHLRRLKLLK